MSKTEIFFLVLWTILWGLVGLGLGQQKTCYEQARDAGMPDGGGFACYRDGGKEQLLDWWATPKGIIKWESE